MERCQKQELSCAQELLGSNCGGEQNVWAGRHPPGAQTLKVLLPQVLSYSSGNILEAASPPLPQRCAPGPREGADGSVWAAAPRPSLCLLQLHRKPLQALGWGEVCAPTNANAQNKRGSLVAPGLPFPALHLPNSTCCGIYPVDCCPREVEGGYSPQRPLFVYLQSVPVSLLSLSPAPSGRARNSLTAPHAHYAGVPG